MPMIASSKHLRSSRDRVSSTAARQMLIGLLVLGSVAILTVLFSFLGTISCAALLGMMFSTIRQPKWQVAGISLVFPLVSFALNQALTREKNLLLAAICFAVFWSCYLFTCAALYLEAPQAAAPVRGAADLSGMDLAAATKARTPSCDPELLELQGRWDRQGASLNSARAVAHIDVNGDRLLVTVADAEGKLRTGSGGSMRVKRVGPYKAATVSGLATDGCDVSTRFSSGTWLYKVSGNSLTIVWNFEETGQEPVIETYQRPTAC